MQIGAYNSRGGEEHTYVRTSKNLNVHVTTAVNYYIRMYVYTELMRMVSNQTFSGQLWHLTGQTKFDQTNLLYTFNEESIN